MNHVLILGAGRGLGAKLARIAAQENHPVFGYSRKENPLAGLKAELANFDYKTADFTTTAGQAEVIAHVLQKDYARIFYTAGGGPHGRFETKQWKDHEWALELSFTFPAKLTHALLQAKRKTPLIFVGSAVAESEPDPLAASYSAAKHALKGLILSVRAENPDWDLRLFSPGYMDTAMLPHGSAPRQHGVYDPEQVAHELWNWSLRSDDAGHKVYPKHPK